jgi:peptidyl-prolyl cis-trans isomerase-like 2
MCVQSYQDPFEEYKKRLANKLAKRAAGGQPGAPAKEKAKDDVNWFGVKVGTANASQASSGSSGGVGKYLGQGLKRTQAVAEVVGVDDAKKKRKIGFGNFEGW